MQIQSRIDALVALGDIITEKSGGLPEIMHRAEMYNPWFTQFHQEITLEAFANNYLNRLKLEKWVSSYQLPESNSKNVALILAGNIPFVGMHDILSVLITGNTALIKQSSKDNIFFPWMYNTLAQISDVFTDKMQFADQLKNFDAVIATGSNNTGRYFDYYFGKYPHIIRKNRSSAAVIGFNDTDESLLELGKDVFYFFGLGCRNVSKIFLPAGFEPEKLFRIWEAYRYVIDNNKYKNNYDYNRTLLLLNKVPHLANDFFMMTENTELYSPLATIHYAYYNSSEELHSYFENASDQLQCIVSNAEGNIPFGRSQYPELWDYADKADTLEFLSKL